MKKLIANLKYYLRRFFAKGIKIHTENEIYEDYYYLFSITCKNCNNNFTVLIKKGYYVKDIITAVKCKNCGCRLKGE